jgi:hypothetical protein
VDRLQLQTLLETLCENVYFQPPSNVEMVFPAIVYQRDNARTEYADNNPYSNTTRYQVMVIDRNPDGPIRAKVADLPMCSYNRFYVVDKLNHDVFNLYA